MSDCPVFDDPARVRTSAQDLCRVDLSWNGFDGFPMIAPGAVGLGRGPHFKWRMPWLLCLLKWDSSDFSTLLFSKPLLYVNLNLCT